MDSRSSSSSSSSLMFALGRPNNRPNRPSRGLSSSFSPYCSLLSKEMLTFSVVLLQLISFLILISTCQAVKYSIPDHVIEKMDANKKPVRIFNNEELKGFNGQDPEKPIFISVKGIVFDVSNAKKFYGMNSPYNVLSGRDATRAVAKMSLNEEDLKLGADIEGLEDRQLQDLEKVFEDVYLAKYPIVGYMDYLLMEKKFFQQMRIKEDF